MKKRVFSILLALALCLTLLPAAAWAEETGAGETTCEHDWEWVPTDAGYNHIEKCKNCEETRGNTQQHDNASGYCSFCHAQLKARVNKSGFYTSLQKALDNVGADGTLTNTTTIYPLVAQENITYSKTTNKNVTLNLYEETIDSLTVTAGTLKIEGQGTINTLTVTGGTVQLSGGTYGNITPPAGKSVNDLLAPGYYAVRTTDGKISVQQAPITNVTVSVSNNDNTVYGYSEADAPVLTATVTPSDLQGVTYQWYADDSLDPNVDGTLIVDATGKTYTLPIGLEATGTGSIGYYCKATIGGCTATSNIAAVTIKKAPSVVSLPDVNVKQVFNDTTTKTINLYDYIRTELNQLKAAAEEAATTGNPIGTMQFKGNGYTPAESIQNGWTVGAETGEITYTIAENQSKGTQITISYKVGFESRESLDSTYILNHEDAEGKIIITLTGIVPTGTPNYTPVTTAGKTLADVNLNGEFKDGDTVVPGTVEWVLQDGQSPEDVTVEKGASYAWKFTPDEDNRATYEGLTGTIIPWTENGSGTVIVITPPEHTADNTTNPATGAAAQPALGLALLAAAVICMDSKLRRK